MPLLNCLFVIKVNYNCPDAVAIAIGLSNNAFNVSIVHCSVPIYTMLQIHALVMKIAHEV